MRRRIAQVNSLLLDPILAFRLLWTILKVRLVSSLGQIVSAVCCVQYFIYCCILGLVSCSVFLRINYELKMVVMLVAVVIYNVIILHTHSWLLDEFGKALYPAEAPDRYPPPPPPPPRQRLLGPIKV